MIKVKCQFEGCNSHAQMNKLAEVHCYYHAPQAYKDHMRYMSKFRELPKRKPRVKKTKVSA